MSDNIYVVGGVGCLKSCPYFGFPGLPAAHKFLDHIVLRVHENARARIAGIQINPDQFASDGSCLRTDHAALSAQGFSANYPFIASTQLQLGLGIPLSTSPSDLANQVRQVTHGLAVLLRCRAWPLSICALEEY